MTSRSGRPGPPDLDESSLTVELDSVKHPGARARGFRVCLVSAARESASWEAVGAHLSIGAAPSNDVVIAESTVSRFHCEVRAGSDGIRLRDLGSRNGTELDGTPIVEAWLRNGSLIRIGRVTLRFELVADTRPLPMSDQSEIGGLVGESEAMRTVFALLERVSATDSTVLLEGETGTGKDVAAEAIHQASPRRDKALGVVDCGAVPANLLESQLFGHERGAFTGADDRRVGAFEDASGGTLFLDEIGELPLELQPKLLRVLEQRKIQRVGSNTLTPVDVRIVAATNRDLRAEVNEAKWREDLYYRLAVVKVRMPPLREHLEDLPMLLDRLLQNLGADDEAKRRLTSPEFVASLRGSAWPGNVRELRNYVERCLVFDQQLPLAEGARARPGAFELDVAGPYDEARRKTVAEFERRYIEAQLRAHDDNVSRAARAAGIGRVYFYKLMRRHGLR